MPEIQHLDGDAANLEGTYALLALEDVRPFRMNPRQTFPAEGLAELADSIRVHGVLQPILVRPQPVLRHGREGYNIIAGERRWRACHLAGLTHIPAMIRDGMEHRQAIAASLIENIQRQDLNAIEEALAISALAGMGYKQAEIGPLVGLSQSALANRLRLLTLPDGIQGKIIAGGISVGLALGLMARVNEWRDELDVEVDVTALANSAVRRGVTVRELQQGIPDDVRADLFLPASPASGSPPRERRKRRDQVAAAALKEAHATPSRRVCPCCGGSGFVDADFVDGDQAE